MIKLSTIKPNPDNPRVIKDGNFRKLQKSIQDFPQMMSLRPMVIDDNCVILGGNMRYRALQDSGVKEVPDDWIKRARDLTEEQKREFIIKDNVGFGEWDWDALANEWDDLSLADWGLDLPEINEVEPEAQEDDYEVPEGGIETDIVLGDLFEIGEHRLMCGDSTKKEDVAKLMNGEKADMVFTDPPYNISFKPQRGTHDEILNDDMSEDAFNSFLDSAFTNANSVLKENSYLFSFSGWPTIPSFNKALKEYFTIKAMPIWVKNNFGIGYYSRPKYEPFFLCLKGEPNKPNTAPADVWEYDKVHTTIHSCEKPIKLITDILTTYGFQGLCYEPFGGSGTTLIACEQLNRKCYGMELDPKYCQVIADRMRNLDPTLEIKRNGEIWNGGDE